MASRAEWSRQVASEVASRMAAPGGAAAAAEGTAEAAEVPETLTEEAMVERSLLASLGGQGGAEMAKAISDELRRQRRAAGDAKAETESSLLESLSDPDIAATLLCKFNPDLSERCAEHDWPAAAFTACRHACGCLKALIADAEGEEILDAHTVRLQAARERDERAKLAPRLTAERRTFAGTFEGVVDPVLEAVLAGQRERREQQQEALGESLETAQIAVANDLEQRGCCREVRAAFVARSAAWLSRPRKRKHGERRTGDGGTRRALLPAAEALALPCCDRGCPQPSVASVELLRREYNSAADAAERARVRLHRNIRPHLTYSIKC